MLALLNSTTSTRFAGYLVVHAILGLVLVNSALMVLWPSKWLRLPPYIGFQGIFLRKRPSPDGWYVEIRLLGCLVFGIVSWMLVGILGGEESVSNMTLLFAFPGGSHAVRTIACLVTCVGALACGGLMLFRPKWWFDRYLKLRNNDWPQGHSVPLVSIRLLSLLIIVPAVYLAFNCLTALR